MGKIFHNIFQFEYANFLARYEIWDSYHFNRAGMGNVRPKGHIRPAKHLNVARELRLKFSKYLFWFWKHVKER